MLLISARKGSFHNESFAVLDGAYGILVHMIWAESVFDAVQGFQTLMHYTVRMTNSDSVDDYHPSPAYNKTRHVRAGSQGTGKTY